MINKFNLTEQTKLEKMETFVTAKRLLDLQKKPMQGNFDLKHLKMIHQYIFQDIYSFAGKLRTENIAKDSFMFANAIHIEDAAKELFKELRTEKRLSGLPFEEFCDRAGYYMTEINVLHPFREGNGRAQREFIRTLALKNGYYLDWTKVNSEKMLSASKLSTVDYTKLSEVINTCITNFEPSKELKKQYDRDNENELER